MGYIDGFEDIMEMETGFLQYTMELLKTSYAKELELLKIKLPDVTSIPRVRFDEAKQRVAEKYNRQFRNPFDLEPEEEVLIGQYFKEEYGSDFVFVTHYPSKMICCGMAGLIAFQSFLNISVATGILPNTGTPLPFVSYGPTWDTGPGLS